MDISGVEGFDAFLAARRSFGAGRRGLRDGLDAFATGSLFGSEAKILRVLI